MKKDQLKAKADSGYKTPSALANGWKEAKSNLLS